MKNKKNLIPYFFIAPAVILFLVFTVYPIIASFLLSFQELEKGKYLYAGLANYKRLLNDKAVFEALKNTLMIWIIQVPIMIFFALILASLLNSKLLKLKGLFRVGFFMPAVTSLVAYSILFSIILLDKGIVNQSLNFLGIGSIPWLTDPFWAKVSIIIAMTWRWTGYNMVIYLAGLQNISEEMYEASSLDGASKIKQFFYITIPQLKPLILFTLIVSTISTLQLFDEPFNLTKGGPGDSSVTLGLLIYRHGFNYFDFSYASAISYLVVFLVIILSVLQKTFARREK